MSDGWKHLKCVNISCCIILPLGDAIRILGPTPHDGDIELCSCVLTGSQYKHLCTAGNRDGMNVFNVTKDQVVSVL